MKTELDLKIITALERLATVFRNLLQEQAQELRLSPIQVQFVLYLAKHPPGFRRVSQLAKVFGLTQATVSDSIRILKEKGLVVQERDTSDGRIVLLNLSQTGETLAQKLESWTDVFYTILEDCPASEKETVVNFVLKLLASLHKRGKLPIARICFLCRFFRGNKYPESDAPHHCVFLDKPMRITEMNIDCPHHHPQQA